MKKFVIPGSILVVILCILIGSTFAKNILNKDNVMHTSYDGLFTIETDDTWQSVVKSTLHKAANIELANYDTNKYLMALIDKKADLNNIKYEDYTTRMISDIEKTYKIKIEQKNKIRINGKETMYVEFKSTTTNENINFYMKVYMIETKNYYARLFTWTTFGQQDFYKKEFDEIAKKFRER